MTYPEFKLGEEAVKEVPVPPTYGKSSLFYLFNACLARKKLQNPLPFFQKTANLICMIRTCLYNTCASTGMTTNSRRCAKFDTCTSKSDDGDIVPVFYTGCRGRPAIAISKEQLELY